MSIDQLVSRDGYISSARHSWFVETKTIREAIRKAKESRTRQSVEGEEFKLCGNRWRLDITIAEDRVIPSVQCLDPETVVERNNTIVMDILMADFNGVMLVKKTQNDKRESPWQVTTTEMLRNLDRDNQKVNCEVMFELFKAKSIDRKIMWNQLRVQNKFTDVILQPSSGDPLPAHKAVLAASSPVMNTMLNSSFSEGKSGTIQLPFPHAVVESALEYMYSGEYNLAHAMQIDAAKDLLQFAIMYELPELFDLTLMRLSALLTIDVVVEATHVCNLLKQQFCDDVKTEKTDQPNPHKPFYTSTMRFSKELDGFVTNNALEIAKKYLSTLPPPPLQPKTHDSHGLQPLPRVPLPQVPLPEKEKEKENIPDTKSHKAAQKREREEEETTCVNASKRVKVTAETPSSLIAP